MHAASKAGVKEWDFDQVFAVLFSLDIPNGTIRGQSDLIKGFRWRCASPSWIYDLRFYGPQIDA
jgi:hypothetical protein